jgi:hypothetical protein
LKNAAIAARSAAVPKIPKELIDQFITGPMTGEAVNAASMAFKKVGRLIRCKEQDRCDLFVKGAVAVHQDRRLGLIDDGLVPDLFLTAFKAPD